MYKVTATGESVLLNKRGVVCLGHSMQQALTSKKSKGQGAI